MYHPLPDSFLSLKPYELHEHFDDLSLVKIPGVRPDYLFISIMLHGNEHTGLLVIQKILKKFGTELPRGIILLIGNVQAAKNDQRRHNDQPDFNRIWKGSESAEPSPIYAKAQEILFQLKKQNNIFAGIDIHNNTGRNPPYACINKLETKLVNMSKHFSETCVYFTKPDQVLSMALNEFAPAITIECGLSRETEGLEKAFDLINHMLYMEEISRVKPVSSEVAVYHTFATMKIADHWSISFDPNSGADIELISHFDALNFKVIKVGDCIGRRNNSQAYIKIIDDSGLDLSENFLSYETSGAIRFKRSIIPSMLTKNVSVIYQDCLGYLMEEFSLELFS